MPRLRPRREAFAQNIIRSAKNGATIARCYEDAGYRTSGHASEAAASRLLSSVEIKERLDELARPMLKKTAISVESLTAELAQTIQDARQEKQHGTVVKALELSARLVGLLREKVDVDVSYGGSRQEIMQSIAKRFGQDAADTLAKALSNGPDAITERRALFARDVTTPEKRRVDEASPELIAGQRRD
jgi:hypothetical protein